MRHVWKPQLILGQTAVEEMEFDPHCRDDIPAVLRGLQHIYSNEALRKSVFRLLESSLLDAPGNEEAAAGTEARKPDPTVGRPGMALWEILVLAVLQQGIYCDYDRLEDLANNHRQVRQMLGCSFVLDGTRYNRRTISRNVVLLTPGILAEINRLVVAEGHDLSGWNPGERLAARCDSFVVETNVHFPTDVSLLWDATRGLVRAVKRACKERGLPGWRQARHLIDKFRGMFHGVRTAARRKSNPEAVTEYVQESMKLADRAEASLEQLDKAGIPEGEANEIKGFLGHARRQADQVYRRLVVGEKIPHEEKVLSIFEVYTRWCQKGKAGITAELGVPVTVVESEHQFVLNARVMWTESDVDVATEVIAKTREWYPDLAQCSFDKGYHSPANQRALGAMLELNAMPSKGRPTKAARKREGSEEFKAARRQHPAVESAINNLEKRGLDRVRNRGEAGFERTVWISVMAANCHRIGRMLQERERKRIRGPALQAAA